MTREEKQQLLFKELCARLPYGIVIHTEIGDVKLDRNRQGIGMLYYEHYSREAKKECGYNKNDCSIIISGCFYGHNIKPYLRPMSSMTEEEKKEYHAIDSRAYTCPEDIAHIPAADRIDWLNKKGFDYRGLIPMGLALEAPEDMYKIE